MIRDLAARNAKNVNYIKCNGFVRGRYAHKLTSVRAMKRLSGHHLVSFRNLVVDAGVYIGEGGEQHGEELFCPLEVRHF